jgi:hypothetical protein
MRYTDDPIGPEANASALRRLSLRLRALTGCPPWERPLHKMHENIACAILLISTARFLINSSRRFIASRPLWKAEQLPKAARRLTRATDHIHRATYAMQEANAALAGAPESDPAAAEQLAADTKRMLQVAAALNMVAMQLDVAVANAAVADAVLLERSGHIADERPEITVPRRSSGRSRTIHHAFPFAAADRSLAPSRMRYEEFAGGAPLLWSHSARSDHGSLKTDKENHHEYAE